MEELAYHSSIQEHLVALSNLDERVGPDELICGWFDDLYFPADKERGDRGQREWRECFNREELAILADFHQIFSQHVDNLIKAKGAWRLDPHWLAVRDAAKDTLDRFRAVA